MSPTVHDTLSERKRTYLKTAELPFSDAVIVGDTLYLSGRIGLIPGTRRVPAEPDAEALLLLQDVASVLERAGMTMDDLVYVQIFCPDVALWDDFNAVYRTFFHGDLPARAFVGSGKLLFDARFEFQGIAVGR